MDESSHSEGLASHAVPESCLGVRKGVVEALTGAGAGRVLSSVIFIVPGADVVPTGGRQHRVRRNCEMRTGRAESETPRTHRSTLRGSREIPRLAWRTPGPRFEPLRGTRAMPGLGKSDGFVVPAKSSNKAGGAPPAAERMEGRSPAKGNLLTRHSYRTQSRTELPQVRQRVRRALCARALSLAARARCGNSARRDPCGGAVGSHRPLPRQPLENGAVSTG